MTTWPLALLLAAAANGPPAASATATPPPGRYDARLCVSLSAQAPSCGPLEGLIEPDGTVILRLDDIRYVLVFGEGALLSVTLHGNMVISEFVSSFRWLGGDTLLFGDQQRQAQYEVRLARPAPPAPR